MACFIAILNHAFGTKWQTSELPFRRTKLPVNICPERVILRLTTSQFRRHVGRRSHDLSIGGSHPADKQAGLIRKSPIFRSPSLVMKMLSALMS